MLSSNKINIKWLTRKIEIHAVLIVIISVKKNTKMTQQLQLAWQTTHFEFWNKMGDFYMSSYQNSMTCCYRTMNLIKISTPFFAHQTNIWNMDFKRFCYEINVCCSLLTHFIVTIAWSSKFITCDMSTSYTDNFIGNTAEISLVW